MKNPRWKEEIIETVDYLRDRLDEMIREAKQGSKGGFQEAQKNESDDRHESVN